jgi:hypothetical protein
MAISQKEEARALNADEHELVVKSHHPNLQALPDAELADLVKLVRARREKAKTQAGQRRREIRGKAAPKGATPSKADEGSKVKLAVLAMAMRRLNGEVTLRHQIAARGSLADNAKKALAMKRGAESKGAGFNSRQAHQGMRNTSNQRPQNLVRPMETGRLRKAASVAQAKRDGR